MADKFVGDIVGGTLDLLGLTGEDGLLGPGDVTMETDPFSLFLTQHYQDLMPMFFNQPSPRTSISSPTTTDPSSPTTTDPSSPTTTDPSAPIPYPGPFPPPSLRGIDFPIDFPGGFDDPSIPMDSPPVADPTSLSGGMDLSRGFQTAPTYDPNSPFGQAMGGTLSGQAIDPASLGMLGNQDVEDYFQSTMYDPAMQNYQNRILPQLREGATNLHSSYRQNLEAGTLGQLHSDLMSQRGNLQYQNLLNNQRMLQSTAGQNLNAQMQAMGMSQAYDPRLQWLNLIGGQTPSSVAVQNPSTMDQIGQMAGIGALISMI
jgi:hypothetical protein